MATTLVDMQPAGSSSGAWIRGLAVACALLLVGAVVGLVTVGESGAGSGGGEDAVGVLAAADKTLAATSARFTSEVAIEARGMPAGVPTMSMKGQIEFSTGRGTFSMSMGPAKVDIRSTGGIAYVSAAGSPMMGLKPGTWYALDADQATATNNPLGSIIGSTMGNPDPRAAFELLREEGVIERVTETGTETIGGEQVHVYRVVVDAAAYERLMADPNAANAEQMALIEFEDVVIDVFISDDGLVRRNVLDLRLGGQGQSVSIKATTNYSDFGAPVEVQEPPADKVVRVGSREELQALIRGGR